MNEAAEFSVECRCGKRVPVTPGMAGTEVACPCGEAISVPGLSQLRQSAGQDAYATNAAEMIRKRRREGRLPAGETCVDCGGPARRLVELEAVCERPWVQQDDSADDWSAALLNFLGRPLGWFWRSRRRDGPPEDTTLGRETVVYLPLRICANCQQAHGDLRHQRGIRNAIAQVPEYRQLLEEYPDTELRVNKIQEEEV